VQENFDETLRYTLWQQRGNVLLYIENVMRVALYTCCAKKKKKRIAALVMTNHDAKKAEKEFDSSKGNC